MMIKNYKAGKECLPLFVHENSHVIPILCDTRYWSCQKGSHRGDDEDQCCHYTLCDGCYEEKTSKSKGDPNVEKSPIEKARRICCHELIDLQARTGMWYCQPVHIGTWEWFLRPHACFGCKGAFVEVNQKKHGVIPVLPKNFKGIPRKEELKSERVREQYDKWKVNKLNEAFKGE